MSYQLYILYEHASGYAVFFVKEFEEVALQIPQVEKAVGEAKRFKKLLKIVGFCPFETSAQALENCNAISEGVVTKQLKKFLKKTLPSVEKTDDDADVEGNVNFKLGVSDAKLGSVINELLSVSCIHTGVVPEIIRGIRKHFTNLICGFTDQSSNVAQLGLGHAYSRSKVKFNIHRSDNMIIQSIAILDQLDKDINGFTMRLREWYSFHFPELIKIVTDSYQYSKLIKTLKSRENFAEENIETLEEVVGDREKAEAIISAAKSSMGMDINEIDLINIEMFSDRVLSLCEYRNDIVKYLRIKMESVAPNLSAILGDQIAARLISKAGSISNLAKMPASTVQILGAEKALFRALKKRTKTPKYGLLYNSTFIARATMKNKGRISRFLANKCAIASSLDCYREKSTDVFGVAMRKQIEDRLKFYETGQIPKSNSEVMKEAMMQIDE